jgi:hypothetical protein
MGKAQYGEGVERLHINICVAVLGAIVDENHDDWNQRDVDSETEGNNELKSPAPTNPSTLKAKERERKRNNISEMTCDVAD